jgi:hypothetical protein
MNVVSEKRIQVRFTITEDGKTYSDALYFTEAEHAAATTKQIEDAQVARFNQWKAVVTAPPKEPTDEEKQAEVDTLVEEKARIESRIAELSVKPAPIKVK